MVTGASGSLGFCYLGQSLALHYCKGSLKETQRCKAVISASERVNDSHPILYHDSRKKMANINKPHYRIWELYMPACVSVGVSACVWVLVPLWVCVCV